MEVNTSKTKVIVYKKGGGLRKEEKWKYKGEDLEVVKEYKYLGYWFSSTGKNEKHMRKISIKCRNFDSKLIKELSQLLGIRKTRATPLHP